MKTLIVLGAALLCQWGVAQAMDSIYDIPVTDIQGNAATLKAYKGKVLLIVNVASKCGHTPQYAGLEALQLKYADKGFAVLAFPCNQFGGQEPGTKEEIKQFCSTKYNVTFPLFDKIQVNGPKRHPLYARLVGNDSPAAGDVKWNFTKLLVGRDGQVLQRFEPKTKPEAPELVQALETALNGR